MSGRLFVWVQHLLPRYGLTSLVYRLARVRLKPVKDALIRSFIRLYNVDVTEIAQEVPHDFRTFNDFFTRDLAAGARPVDTSPGSIVSPVDGTVSVATTIDDTHIFQAKGLDYSLDDLLAIDLDNARAFENGIVTTIYLAPYNYHRVHMPINGHLVAAHYVPGDLFSVNALTAGRINGLFRRNERLNLHFETAVGPVALILVGALNVGSITTPWTGEIRPRKNGVVETCQLGRAPRALRKGDLLGWFNMGSTVIVLLPKGSGVWNDNLKPGEIVRTGSAIGHLSVPQP